MLAGSSMQVLNSRVARRLLGMVVLLVICPVILTALIAYEAINRQVVSNAETQMHLSAKSYLLEVIGRLRVTDQSLRNLILRLGQVPAAGPVTSVSGRALGLVDVVTGSPSAPYEFLPTEVQATVREGHDDAVDGGQTRMAFVAADSGPADIYLVRSWADGADGRYVAARIDPAFLWESASLMPFGHYYCITTTQGMSIFCPDTENLKQSATFGTGAARNAKVADTWWFDANGKTYLASGWGGPVTVEFGIPDLVVTVAQTEGVLKSPVYSFVRTVPPALGIAVLSAILLAMIIIRRRMRPLDQLTDAAAQLARGNFSSAVRVDADDEFLGLARMFDDMRIRLGQQFTELAILSNVDQAILKMESLATIIERSTPEIVGAFPGRLFGTVLLDQA
ncbi:MAG: HAMP domain-containing protein, partial [Gammaproteobacteria bacterium]|nr:HAMP domain-containing protein [Gammaproteobacteria bacterium]